jgi:peptide alpha-N-acetyltransferase
MSDIPAKRALPPKESTLFKELLTLYETRQLKKALKTADQILKKFPEHGGACAGFRDDYAADDAQRRRA